MNTAKIDAAVLLMQGLSPEERAVVAYTIEREAGRPGRKRGSKNREDRTAALQATLGLCDPCMKNEHPNKEHGDCACACAA